jgi:hypothetical protein
VLASIIECQKVVCPTVTQLMRSRLSNHMLALERMDSSLLKPAVSGAPTTLPNAQDGVLSTLILDNACSRVLREDAPDSAGDAGVTEGRGALALCSPPPPWSSGTWRVAPGHPRSLSSTVPCSRSSARPAALHWAASRPCNEAAP